VRKRKEENPYASTNFEMTEHVENQKNIKDMHNCPRLTKAAMMKLHDGTRKRRGR
jgi:hypothetical protein